MSESKLPQKASLEYLKKLAKERLRVMQSTNRDARLSAAQLEIARDYGFSSWRALKAEVDRRRAPAVEKFFIACREGDVATLRSLLESEPQLVHERNASGSPGLHLAVAHPDAVRLLLEHGADPNERDSGDNAYALHFAAADGHLETVRTLLDAGGDVHGFGDVHRSDVIGWAVGDGTKAHREILALLIERGARHHIFTAVALNDKDLVQRIVEEDPQALLRRRSRFEEGQTALHFALAAPTGLGAKKPQYDMAELLIEIGADIEAEDDKGRTPLAVAMLSGDLEAMRRLKESGAKEPSILDISKIEEQIDNIRNSVQRQITPMLCVSNVESAVEWYTSLGFEVQVRYPETGPIEFARLAFGKAVMMLQGLGTRPHDQVALWFHTDRIEDLYQICKAKQQRASKASLEGGSADKAGVHFYEDLYEPFYGGRQFSIRDVNGLELVFQSD